MHVYSACGAVGVFLSLESSLFYFLTGNLAELVCYLKPHPLSSLSRETTTTQVAVPGNVTEISCPSPTTVRVAGGTLTMAVDGEVIHDCDAPKTEPQGRLALR